MGTCWNCNTQVSLDENQTNCDECGEVLYYRCNSCKEEFEVKDKKTKKKLKECKLCGFFICPFCGVCSWKCPKYKWEKEILKILMPEINQANHPEIMGKIKKIINYFEEEKGRQEQRVCPERGVLISYAKNRIKSLLAKVEGFRVKDERDRDAFLKRIDEITRKEIGSELKISEIREDGSYGQEYRDAFNLLVCMGKLKIEKRIFIDGKDKIEYDVYIRCQREPCKFLAKDDLIINECKEPNHQGNRRFPLDMERCPTCPPYKKGKEKGELKKLKKRLTNKDVCQVCRGLFVKKK